MVDLALPGKRRGLLIVLSSPSGVGKTTITRTLMGEDPELTLSVSVTTRPPRPGEIDGVHYHFVDRARYDAMIANKELLEYAEVFNNGYGTPTAPVMAALDAGRDVMFDIDWQGTQQINEKVPDDLVSIFLLPPSRAELERRLRARAQDSDDVIGKRLAAADEEMGHWPEYKYVLVNHDLNATLAHVRAIIFAERYRRRRLTGLADFVRGLRKSS